MNQTSADFSQGLNVQMSFWYLQSKELGKISAGRQANAAKSAAMFTDQSGTEILDNYTFLAGFPQFIIRSGGNLAPASLTWGQLAFCYSQGVPLGGDCNGIVMNAVRYDTPVFAGFSASASWGENDDWEVAARYTGEAAGFEILLGAAYSNSTDEKVTVPLPAGSKKDTNFFQAGGYIQQIATGLFIHGAYGREDNADTVLAGGITPPTAIKRISKVAFGRNGRRWVQPPSMAIMRNITISSVPQRWRSARRRARFDVTAAASLKKSMLRL